MLKSQESYIRTYADYASCQGYILIYTDVHLDVSWEYGLLIQWICFDQHLIWKVLQFEYHNCFALTYLQGYEWPTILDAMKRVLVLWTKKDMRMPYATYVHVRNLARVSFKTQGKLSKIEAYYAKWSYVCK